MGMCLLQEIDITDLAKLGTKPRAEVFDYIEKELKDNLAALSTDVNSTNLWQSYPLVCPGIIGQIIPECTGLYRNTPVGQIVLQPVMPSSDVQINILLKPTSSTILKSRMKDQGKIFLLFLSTSMPGLVIFGFRLATLHYNSNATFGLKGSFGIGGFNGPCSTIEYYNLFNPNDMQAENVPCWSAICKPNTRRGAFAI